MSRTLIIRNPKIAKCETLITRNKYNNKDYILEFWLLGDGDVKDPHDRSPEIAKCEMEK
jgi:hypothetical protein